MLRWVSSLLGCYVASTFCYKYGYLLWRHGGVVVSALDFRFGGRWFEPGLCRRVDSSDKKLCSSLSLFTQLYKWAPAIIMLG